MRGLTGLRGQSMGGEREAQSLPLPEVMISTSSGSYTAPADYIANIFAWGGGASGTSDATYTHGGGGGSAGYSRLIIPAGIAITWLAAAPRMGTTAETSGNVGFDSIVTIDGVIMTAQGGRMPSTSPATRSMAAGFQVNRYGGGSGEAGEFGGAAGNGSALRGGGGAGGFRDIFLGLTGENGRGSTSSNGAQIVPGVGAGGGANTSGSNWSTWGGPGLVLIQLYRI